MQQFLRFPFLRMEKLFFAFTWYEFHDSDLIIVSKVVVALFLEAKLNLESKTYFIQICTYYYLELYICQKSLFNKDYLSLELAEVYSSLQNSILIKICKFFCLSKIRTEN